MKVVGNPRSTFTECITTNTDPNCNPSLSTPVRANPKYGDYICRFNVTAHLSSVHVLWMMFVEQFKYLVHITVTSSPGDSDIDKELKGT